MILFETKDAESGEITVFDSSDLRTGDQRHFDLFVFDSLCSLGTDHVFQMAFNMKLGLPMKQNIE